MYIRCLAARRALKGTLQLEPAQVVTLYCFHKFNLFEMFRLNERSFIAYLDAVVGRCRLTLSNPR